jgi:hypothetical protein
MRSPLGFIATPLGDRRYANERDGLLVSTSQEDHRFSNRIAVVKEVPVGYDGPITPGCHLLVHHNVFKFYYDMQGAQRSGRSFLGDGEFLIEPEQYYMWREEGSDWSAVGSWVFVEPAPASHDFMFMNVKHQPLTGFVRYGNDELYSLGVLEDTRVVFAPDSEYSFYIGDTEMYRMRTSDILLYDEC